MKMHKKGSIHHWFSVMLTAIVVAASLCGCGTGKTSNSIPMGAAENEILTLSPVAQDKEMVTIHYE